MGKRKASGSHTKTPKKKTRSSVPPAEPRDVKAAFRPGLFDEAVLKEYREQYRTSGPYTSLLLSSLYHPPTAHLHPATRTP